MSPDRPRSVHGPGGTSGGLPIRVARGLGHLALVALVQVVGVALWAGDARPQTPPVVDASRPPGAADLLAIGTLLPERPLVGSQLLSGAFDPNLHLMQDSRVAVTLMAVEPASHPALGYVTFEPGTGPGGAPRLLERELVLTDLGDPSLEAGDTFFLRDGQGQVRTFAAGTWLGWFLLPGEAAGGADPEDWDALSAPAPTDLAVVNDEAGVFTSVDAWNPEASNQGPARHALLQEASPGLPATAQPATSPDQLLLLSLETRSRLGADAADVNDVVLLVSAEAPGAFDLTGVVQDVWGDPDGDGVGGTDDHFPHDPDRALVVQAPPQGRLVLGLEDLYPVAADRDYNDAVAAFSWRLVLSAGGRIKDLEATLHLLARGSNYAHRFGLHLPGLPDEATGSLSLERFYGDVHELESALPLSTLHEAQKRLETLLPFSHIALPPGAVSSFVNTVEAEVERLAASARVVITLDTAVEPAVLGSPALDLYALVFDGASMVDVHLPGFPSFPDLHGDLPAQSGPEAFLDEEGYPYLLAVPGNWRFPLETSAITKVYPAFEDFAASHGSESADWYQTVKTKHASLEASAYVDPPTWSLGVLNP